MAVLDRVLTAWKFGRALELDARGVSASEGIGLDAGLARRSAYRRARPPLRLPALAVIIIGAPRSGTSHLLNLLAYQRSFAWLGSDSCWAWPTYGLLRREAPLISDRPPELFAVDSKRLRLDPGTVVPTEVEDLLARSIPSYRHLGAHRYDLIPARVAHAELLLEAISRHMDYFHTDRVVLKSPFSSFRVRELSEVFGSAARFVHIHRDGYTAAASIAENGFAYSLQGVPASAAEGWAAFVRAALAHSDDVPMHTLSFEDLLREPAARLGALLDWLGIKSSDVRLPSRRPTLRARPRAEADPLIESLHQKLGRGIGPIH